MKKIYPLLIVSVGIFLPFMLVMAITPGTIPTGQDLGIQQAAPTGDIQGFVGYLATIVKWTYTLFFITAVFFFLLAAFNYLTGGSNPANVTKAHKMLLWAAIAIVVAFMSVGFEVIIKSLLIPGSSGTTTDTTSNSYQTSGQARPDVLRDNQLPNVPYVPPSQP